MNELKCFVKHARKISYTGVGNFVDLVECYLVFKISLWKRENITFKCSNSYKWYAYVRHYSIFINLILDGIYFLRTFGEKDGEDSFSRRMNPSLSHKHLMKFFISFYFFSIKKNIFSVEFRFQIIVHFI